MEPKTLSGRGRVVRGARAFTLVEAVVVITIIALITSVLLVALSASVKSSRVAAERQEIRSLVAAVQQFKTTFGFLPPLLDDEPNPVVGGRLVVRPDPFLWGNLLPNEPRYSVYSLPYFVMGMADARGTGGRPIDGAAGPRLTKPNPDGSFVMAGEVYESFAAAGSKDATRIVRHENDQERIVVVDRWGRGTPFIGTTPPVNSLRYYRWLPKYTDAPAGQARVVNQYMVPRAVGDPNKDPALRGASFAIMSVGPNGLTDDRRPLPRAEMGDSACDPAPINIEETKDDIVEVGG